MVGRGREVPLGEGDPVAAAVGGGAVVGRGSDGIGRNRVAALLRRVITLLYLRLRREGGALRRGSRCCCHR